MVWDCINPDSHRAAACCHNALVSRLPLHTLNLNVFLTAAILLRLTLSHSLTLNALICIGRNDASGRKSAPVVEKVSENKREERPNTQEESVFELIQGEFSGC